MKLDRLTVFVFCLFFSQKNLAQDIPFENTPQDSVVTSRDGCIEVLNQSQFFAGEFGGGIGTSSVCFSFPSTCGAEIHMNSNSVVDFLQFFVNGDTSGVIGVGSYGFDDLQILSTGDVVLLPFDFVPTQAFQGPINVDVGPGGFIVGKADQGLPGDMFVTVSLANFSVFLLSNRDHFTNYSIECKPLNICTDYVGLQYIVACPGKDLFLVSKCYDPDYKTVWINPFGDTTICDKDTLRINNPVPVGLYQWTTPCNTGYVLVYDPDSIRIREHAVGCASKTKLSLPLGLKGDWSNGVTKANYINVTEPGLYWAEINGCFRDSIWSEIIFNQLDLGFHLMPDQDTVLFSTNLTVTAEAIPGTNISWYRDGYGIQGYNGPGLYTCIATLEECREYDTLLVIPHLFQGCDWPVYKPNAFSPNNDGVNDLFRVFGPDGSISHIWVYNRWGGLLYSGQAWDGTCGNKELEPGVYTFRAKVVWGFEECSSVCGDITLIR